MIITLTMNPAVDVSMTVERLVPEHKLTCSQPRYDAGGGGVNVAKALHRLGINATALFTSGGHTGLTLQTLIGQESVDYEAIPIQESTRECFVVTETSTNQQYRFGMPGPTMPVAEADACLARLEAQPEPVDYLVVSGSLPPGLPDTYYAQIAQLARRNGWRMVLDAAGEPLRLALEVGVFLIKPNIGELARLVGVEQLEPSQISEAAWALIQAGKCEMVAVSLGPRGAMLFTATDEVHVPAPPVKKQSTVGAGDSLVGGLVYGLAKGLSPLDLLRVGVACGSAATMNAGTQLFHKTDVDALLDWFRRQPTSAL